VALHDGAPQNGKPATRARCGGAFKQQEAIDAAIRPSETWRQLEATKQAKETLAEPGLLAFSALLVERTKAKVGCAGLKTKERSKDHES